MTRIQREVNMNEVNCKDSEKLVCPECGKTNVSTSMEDYTFDYGSGDGKVELTAVVPVRVCNDCGCKYMDYLADEAQHEAVCKYKKVLSPSQIRSLRSLYNFSQSEFANISKLGEATLSRWERGVVIQNEAYDNYLYLLGFASNLRLIMNRHTSKVEQSSVADLPKFRRIEITDELLTKQSNFELHPGQRLNESIVSCT